MLVASACVDQGSEFPKKVFPRWVVILKCSRRRSEMEQERPKRRRFLNSARFHRGLPFRLLVVTGIAVLGGSLCSNSLVLAASAYRDFGSSGDFDPANEIWVEPYDGAYGWRSRPWMHSSDYETMAWHENSEGFWWVTSEETTDVVSSRAIKYRHLVYIRIDATGFSPDQTVYLTIRYKDDVMPGAYGGAPIFVYRDGGYNHVATIGGGRDFRWKTEQIVIPPDQISIHPSYSEYIVRIGESSYSNSIVGHLPIDKMKLSDEMNMEEFESDADGYWPEMPSDLFANIGNTNVYRPGGTPFFPFGFYDYLALWITDGGSATSPGYEEKDSWQIMEDARINCYLIHGYTSWHSKWELHPGEFSWDDPGVCVEPGLDEHLIQAAGHNLKVIPNFLTETRAWWIANKYGSEKNTLDTLRQIMFTHRDEPSILMWNPVDEWDHERVTYGKPHLFSQQLYATQRQVDPNRPGFMTLMGYMGPTSWELASQQAQVVGTDYYVYGEGSTVEGRLLEQAQQLDEMRAVLSDSVARIMVPEGMMENVPPYVHDGVARTLYAEEVVVQAYIAITHGAQGLIYFRGMHPDDPRADGYGGYERVWEGLRQVGEDLFGPEGFAHVLLHPSTTLDIMGENGIVTSTNPAIHHICRVTPVGETYLVSVNATNSPQSTSFCIDGLEDGISLQVLFEGRSIGTQAGCFEDSFDGYGRHVYVLDRVSRTELDRSIKDHKTGRATVEQVEEMIERYYRGE